MRLFAVIAFSASAAHAQVAYDSPRGPVEVLGLESWTLAMLRDSVQSRRPGVPLEDAACMAVLREELGFPDALVQVRRTLAAPGHPAGVAIVIKVVEPRARARVRWLPPTGDSATVVRPEYLPVVVPVLDSSGVLGFDRLLWPMQLHHADSAIRRQAVAAAPAARRADAARLWAFLDARTSTADRRRAQRVLRSDGSVADRMIAAAILGNFPESDSTWWALVDALRDPHHAVRSAAAASLQTLPRRPVAWTPVIESLRYLVGGTNVAATEQLYRLLAETRVAPSLASALLRGNKFWILEHLRARTPGAADAARRLLVQLHDGQDLGPGPDAWAAWIGTL